VRSIEIGDSSSQERMVDSSKRRPDSQFGPNQRFGRLVHEAHLSYLYLTMTQAEAERLEESGAEFACIQYHEPTQRIMTVPVGGRAT
jgi:hypothetical protein